MSFCRVITTQEINFYYPEKKHCLRVIFLFFHVGRTDEINLLACTFLTSSSSSSSSFIGEKKKQKKMKLRRFFSAVQLLTDTTRTTDFTPISNRKNFELKLNSSLNNRFGIFFRVHLLRENAVSFFAALREIKTTLYVLCRVNAGILNSLNYSQKNKN
jgi:hypothetical protein